MNENPIDVIPLTLQPGQVWKHVIRNTTNQGGMLHASLDYDDALQSDNHADAVLPARPVQKLLYYGEDDFFLGHVLVSQPNVEFTRLQECPAAVPDDAVLVLHRTVPETLPSGNVLVIDPQTDSDLWNIGDSLEMPLVAHQDSESALMRHVHLTNVLMPGARLIEPLAETGFQVLLETPEQSPLYLLHEQKGRTVLTLTAELKKGDLPLRTAFPIMVAQSLAYFRGIGGELERAYTTSESIDTVIETDATQLLLRGPDGAEQAVAVYHREALDTVQDIVADDIAVQDTEQNESSPSESVSLKGTVSLGTLSQAGLLEPSCGQ